MDPNNHKQLIKYINKQLCLIIDDYTVIEHIEDGSDKYGLKYWVQCKNGWHDRSWLRDIEIKKQIDKRVYNDVKDGYIYKGTTYYFDLSKLYKLCHILYNSKR